MVVGNNETFVQALTSNANLKGETGTPNTHSEDKKVEPKERS